MASDLILLTVAFFLASTAHGASCCGGGAGLPTLITGDYRGQIGLFASSTIIKSDSNAEGKVAKRGKNNHEMSEVFSLSAAYLVSPLWQVGITIPYKMNTRQAHSYSESSQGLGDQKIQVAYEFLPEYFFSPWKPKGYIYIEETFPTSKSSYDADKRLRSDSFGNGFFLTSLGISLVKKIGDIDLLFMSEIHHGLKRSFFQNDEFINVRPGAGGSILMGGGFSFQDGAFRSGANILYSREGGRKLYGSTTILSEPSYVWEASLVLTYQIKNFSLSLTYKDQSSLAKASNTVLSQSIGFSVINFFEL